MDFLFQSVVIGLFATFVIDVWAFLLLKLLKMPMPKWDMVGRWVLYLFMKGKLSHTPIGASSSLKHERLAGWIFHYFIGIVFASIYLHLVNSVFQSASALTVAIVFGWATISAPWFIMQPGMGMGIAGARTAAPTIVRIQSIMTHSIFGLSLYGAMLGLAALN